MKEPQSMIEAMEELRKAGRELLDELAKTLRLYDVIDWLNRVPLKWQSIIYITLRALLLLIVLLMLIELSALIALLVARAGWL